MGFICLFWICWQGKRSLVLLFRCKKVISFVLLVVFGNSCLIIRHSMIAIDMIILIDIIDIDVRS